VQNANKLIDQLNKEMDIVEETSMDHVEEAKKAIAKIKLKKGTKIGHEIADIGPGGKKTVVTEQRLQRAQGHEATQRTREEERGTRSIRSCSR